MPHHDDSIFQGVIGLIIAAFLFFGMVAFSNANEVERCKSLNKQGVAAYISDGFFTKECHVIERVIQK